MKQRNLKKKVGALLLAAAMTVNLFPAFRTEVHAAELPDNTQFATVEELKAFDTDDTDGANPAKVYFGNNNQQWWIAGSQNGNLTLFAASPLATGQVFESNYSSDKTYNTDWNCDYTSTGGSAPTDVYPNHYGASPLRATLRNLESSNFTDAEQTLMNTTTIYTNDTKNSSVYSTREKLYLAYGDYYDNQYITVGTNASNTLKGGLRIDKGYWGNAGLFWLRAPDLYIRYYALAAWPGYDVSTTHVRNANALVPAFELNLSSVIFASAAPAAVSDGALTLADTDGDGAFTMRYSTGNLGSAQIAYDYAKVKFEGVSSGAYLVAQNKDGAWAKAVSGTGSVSASNMGLTSFENCKVWLETTNSSERKTYATMAAQAAGKWYDVNVTLGTGMQVQSGSLTQQVDDGQSMTNIAIKTNDGYMFPAGYSVAAQNGITVTRNSDSQITVSGMPTADVNLTLPAATQKAYGMELSGNGTFGILEGADQTWKGSGSLTIKANGDFAKFTGIKVDGTVVDVSHYDAKSGSTVVTLKESYLATLSAGVHTLTFVYDDGEVSTHFMIADKETSGTPEIPDNSTKDNQNTGNRTDTGSSRSPQTGDKTNISLYLLLLLMSGLMIAFCVEWKKIKSKC